MGKAANPMRKATNPMGKATNPMGKAINPMGKATNPMGKTTNPVGKTKNPERARTTAGGAETRTTAMCLAPVELSKAAAEELCPNQDNRYVLS